MLKQVKRDPGESCDLAEQGKSCQQDGTSGNYPDLCPLNGAHTAALWKNSITREKAADDAAFALLSDAEQDDAADYRRTTHPAVLSVQSGGSQGAAMAAANDERTTINNMNLRILTELLLEFNLQFFLPAGAHGQCRTTGKGQRTVCKEIPNSERRAAKFSPEE
jgi:hypothetical protein